MPRKPAADTVLAAVEQDLQDLPERPGTAGLRAMARRLAGVMDGPGPTAPVVAAAKTLESVLAQLRGVPVKAAGDGDGVDRIKRGASRRRGAAT